MNLFITNEENRVSTAAGSTEPQTYRPGDAKERSELRDKKTELQRKGTKRGFTVLDTNQFYSKKGSSVDIHNSLKPPSVATHSVVSPAEYDHQRVF